MTATLDNPRVRASFVCPLCAGPKDSGLLCCWGCFRARAMRNGNTEAERIIAAAEVKLGSVPWLSAQGATVGTGRRMNARFAGRCRCGAAVCRGDAIVYDRGARGVVQCPICRDARAEGSLADAFDRAYEDQCSATCGLGGERDGGG